MEMLHHIFAALPITPFELLFAFVSLAVLLGKALVPQLKGLWTFIQLSLLFYKLMKTFFTKTEEGKKLAAQSDIDEKIDMIYQTKLQHYEEGLLSGKQTGAAG